MRFQTSNEVAQGERTFREKMNDDKRAETAALLQAVRAQGWTPAELALLCGVKRGTITNWTRGASMAQSTMRTKLSGLPNRKTQGGLEYLRGELERKQQWLRREVERRIARGADMAQSHHKRWVDDLRDVDKMLAALPAIQVLRVT